MNSLPLYHLLSCGLSAPDSASSLYLASIMSSSILMLYMCCLCTSMYCSSMPHSRFPPPATTPRGAIRRIWRIPHLNINEGLWGRMFVYQVSKVNYSIWLYSYRRQWVGKQYKAFPVSMSDSVVNVSNDLVITSIRFLILGSSNCHIMIRSMLSQKLLRI